MDLEPGLDLEFIIYTRLNFLDQVAMIIKALLGKLESQWQVRKEKELIK